MTRESFSHFCFVIHPKHEVAKLSPFFISVGLQYMCYTLKT